MQCTKLLGAAVAVVVSLWPALGQASVDESVVSQVLHVDVNHEAASDNNPGTSPALPLKTLQRAIALAAGADTRILVHPGDYREYISIGAAERLLCIQAMEAGTAAICGSNRVSAWRDDGAGVYSFAWQHDWGLGDIVFPPGYQAERDIPTRRKEMVFVDGVHLTQRVTVVASADRADPVAPSSLGPGEFTVDEANDRISFKPPAGVAMTQSTAVDVAVRGTAELKRGGGRSLLSVVDHGNLVLRGLVFKHSANYIKADPALRIASSSSNQVDHSGRASQILIEDCRFVHNNSIGMEIESANNITVRRCEFNDNGLRGAGLYATVNARFEDCRFLRNNWRCGVQLIGHDAAGLKIFDGLEKEYFYRLSSNISLVRCSLSDNTCCGFWQDYGGADVVLRSCLVENNIDRGIDQEMTFGGLVLRGCVIRNNTRCNIQSYGSSHITLDSCFVYGARTGLTSTDPEHIAEIILGGDSRVNSGSPASSEHWTIQASTIISTEPHSSLFRSFWYGGPDAPTSFGKSAFVNTLASDNNRWYRRDTTSFPWPHTMFGTRVFSGGDGWKNDWPDMTWSEYRALRPTSGRLLDQHSVWGDVQLSSVADPTVPQGGTTALDRREPSGMRSARSPRHQPSTAVKYYALNGARLGGGGTWLASGVSVVVDGTPRLLSRGVVARSGSRQ